MQTLFSIVCIIIHVHYYFESLKSIQGTASDRQYTSFIICGDNETLCDRRLHNCTNYERLPFNSKECPTSHGKISGIIIQPA